MSALIGAGGVDYDASLQRVPFPEACVAALRTVALVSSLWMIR